MEMGGQRHAPATLPRERPRTHCVGGWVDTGPVWTDAENRASYRDSIPERPSRSESLY